jgi:hypothetical protein
MSDRFSCRRWGLLALVGGLALCGGGRALLQASEDRHRTRSQQYLGELQVVAREGRVRRKRWRSFREGYAGDARLLVRFLDPPEVRGVGFLSLARPGKGTDQWLYLPSMNRERRIARQDRDSSFVGTDFSYEDLEEFDHTRFDVSMRPDEPVDGKPCSVVEAVPKERDARTVYGRRRVYLQKSDLFVVRVDLFHGDAAQPSKRLTLSELTDVGGHRAARHAEMQDLRTGSRTILQLEELALDRPQPADRFTLQSLNRGSDD